MALVVQAVHPRVLLLLSLIGALLIPGCADGSDGEDDTPGNAGEPGGDDAVEESESSTMDVHESYDLAQGMDEEYSWEVNDPSAASARVLWTGPGDTGIHGPGQVCVEFTIEETEGTSTSRNSQTGCAQNSANISTSISGDNLEAVTLFDVDMTGIDHGEYWLHVVSAPQVGQIEIDIVVEP